MSTSTSQPAVLPGRLYQTSAASVTYRQRFTSADGNLKFIDCGEHHLPAGTQSRELLVPGRELLLYMWRGAALVEVGGKTYNLANYDMLYVPLGATFKIANRSAEDVCLIETSAPAKNVHPVFHAKFAEFSKREERIRHLKGKDVYLMFDVSEGADKLVAGYTFFQAGQRSWPPHNHTDQEEVYIFIKGHGSMEVYESPETLSFVHSMAEGDLATIPMLNYHPVFSQEDPLHFIWCIAGERYWVGDKNKSFMSGSGTSLTT
jgi:mannose-6-phosphate isomerase-like protein (cupin superfamily)